MMQFWLSEIIQYSSTRWKGGILLVESSNCNLIGFNLSSNLIMLFDLHTLVIVLLKARFSTPYIPPADLNWNFTLSRLKLSNFTILQLESLKNSRIIPKNTKIHALKNHPSRQPLGGAHYWLYHIHLTVTWAECPADLLVWLLVKMFHKVFACFNG